jgi:transposase
LIGYLWGISSERKLVEEFCMHLAWRWFTGLGFDQEIPHHSTFSKNRHGRFQETNLFAELFEQIVRQCVEVGLVQGKQLSVDGSFVVCSRAVLPGAAAQNIKRLVRFLSQGPQSALPATT